MKKAYTAPKKLTEKVRKACESACGRNYSCGELVRKN